MGSTNQIQSIQWVRLQHVQNIHVYFNIFLVHATSSECDSTMYFWTYLLISHIIPNLFFIIKCLLCWWRYLNHNYDVTILMIVYDLLLIVITRDIIFWVMAQTWHIFNSFIFLLTFVHLLCFFFWLHVWCLVSCTLLITWWQWLPNNTIVDPLQNLVDIPNHTRIHQLFEFLHFNELFSLPLD